MHLRTPTIVLVVVVILLAVHVAEEHFLLATPTGPAYGLDVPGADVRAALATVPETGYRPRILSFFVRLDTTTLTLERLEGVAAAGMMPMVTLEPWGSRSVRGRTDSPAYSLAAIGTGRYDRQLVRLAATLHAFRRPVLLRFAHEMNGTWYPWALDRNGNTAAGYVAAWRHVHAVFAAAGAGNVQWLWSPNSLLHGQTAGTYRAAYPGDRWVDFLGLTAYGHGRAVATTLDASLRALESVSRRPVVLAETGSAQPGKRAWITAFGPYLRTHRRIVGFVWFDTMPATTGATGDYRFDDNPGDVTAFASSLRAARVARPPGPVPPAPAPTS